MNDSYILSNAEIKKILNNIDKEYHLEVYKILTNVTFSPKITKKDIKEYSDKVIKLFKVKNLPRLLTEEELEDIVNVIPLVPSTIKDIAIDNNRQIKNKIKSLLSKYRLIIKDDTILKIKDYIVDKFYKSSANPGDSVGVIAALSIGAPLTQDNLNTRHKRGTKNDANSGLKFVERLLNLTATKDTDSIKNVIHFKDKNKTREEIYNIGKRLKGISIESLIKPNGKNILYKINEEDKNWYKNYLKVKNINTSILKQNLPFLRIQIDTNKLYNYDLLLEDIIRIIKVNNKALGFKETIECIGSNSLIGIIDIYISEDFARKKLKEFSLRIKKDNNICIGSVEEQVRCFLNKILSNEFKEMIIKGIVGVNSFSISEAIHTTSTFKEVSVVNARDLEKFSKKPYNLKLEDINYLWYIRITKYYIHFMGLDENKYIQLFKEAGLEIVENNFESENPHFIVLMPKDRNVQYIDSNTGRSYKRYKLLDNGRFFDNKDKKWSLNYSPKKLIEENLNYNQEYLLYQINKKLEKSNIEDTNLEFKPIYRYAYYYYVTIEGRNIISELYSNKEVDFKYSYPEEISEINNLFGIEATRFNISSKYNSNSSMEKINPLNIELLIDFQTAYGHPLPVSATTIAQQGNSILTAASFESSLDYIFKGSSVGEKDKIKGISSCIMSGSRCRNGTGIVDCEYSNDYLKDNVNKFIDNQEYIDDFELNIAYSSGACYNTADKDEILDDVFSISNDPKNEKLEPPKMDTPGELEDLLDLEDILSNDLSGTDHYTEKNTFEDNITNLDIPEAPTDDISDSLYNF